MLEITQEMLEGILERSRPLIQKGHVATYIPELSNMNPNYLGLHIITCDGREYSAGDAGTGFTIQSIAKVITLLCCLLDSSSEEYLQKVTFEPTSDGFNTIQSLETKNFNRPLNPMINAGAIASIMFVQGDTPQDKFERVLSMTRTLAGNPQIAVNESVYRSESATGSRNRSLAYYMKSTGILTGDVEEILDAYFKICSMSVTCIDLARIAGVIAKDGISPLTGQELFPAQIAKRLRTVMSLCGMYDESGEYAVNVGLPSKSGVGGGIMAAVPKKMGVCAFSPALNQKGSSVAGIKAMELLSRELELSIY